MNDALLRAINGLAGNRVLDPVMRIAATDLIFVALATVVVLCVLRLRAGDWHPVARTAAALLLTFGLGVLAGAVHAERRPFETHSLHIVVTHAPGQSFPSDHATAAFGVALATLVFLSRSWGLLLTFVAMMIGFSRIYDGVHYPSDILGGAVVAVLGVAVAIVLAQPRRPAPRPYPPVGSARR
jgi:undecaprenyl-diphosphatase